MRALTSFPLNNDIVAHIMACCFTFNTLHSTILICKAFYSVFQAHPKSITRAVAYNIVGPALPQALRMLRYPYPVDNEYISIDPIALAMACPEDPDYSDVLFTAEEKLYLEEDSRTVAALEDIYSLTFKDPTSKTSVLTSEESYRFRRSLYRIMLYCNLFSGSRYNLDEIDRLDDKTAQTIWRQRTAVLNAYPLDEILELHSSVVFLRGLLLELMRNELTEVEDEDLKWVEILFSAGPATVLDAWKEQDYSVLREDLGFEPLVDENKLFSGYFSRALESIWESRKVTSRTLV
ncbi:hypothetical protein B0H14DRAFT_2699498 [Mycena olivaceomarginata]|nr:hypothetical protein B0H14DRAFT_2699498 [Mycena olivaceomarginata]